MPILSMGTLGGSGDVSPDAHGEEFLAQLKKTYPGEMGLVDSVKAVTEGRMPATGRNLQRLMTLAAQYEPGFNGQVFTQRQKAFNDWYGGGPSQKMVKRIDQASSHAESLIKSLEGLGNWDLGPIVNEPANKLGMMFGKTGVNPVQTNAHALADELAGIWKGQNLSDTEIKAWKNAFRVHGSIPQQKEDISKLIELMEGGIGAMENQRRTSFGPVADRMPAAVSPEMHGRIDAIKGWAADPASKWGAAAGQPTATPATQAPPYPNARQAADGKWYVEQDGRFFEVRP